MQTVRLASRLTLFVLFLLLTALIALWAGALEKLKGTKLDRTRRARFCFNGAARCLGLRIRREGRIAEAPVLFVSNHVSWSDIPVLGGLAPLRFLSKAEVRGWPFIGWLAGQAGTLFIQRGGGRSGQSREEIALALEQRQSVLIFPEGTTTDGSDVRPFHQRLLYAAAMADVMIQPVSIGYHRQGKPDHLAPFVGDDDFRSHLLRLLRQPAAEVSVVFHPSVPVARGTDMASLTNHLHETVAAGVRRIHWGGADSISSSVASLT
ncbi:lysophospholipid acyltransferase family protein [Marinobacter sp.]|uniref:lysophospholipid acyltransferase family protein n=1 Tax=Marinobacter sp. TaxID=50741 RepID=UPI00385109DE